MSTPKKVTPATKASAKPIAKPAAKIAAKPVVKTVKKPVAAKSAPAKKATAMNTQPKPMSKEKVKTLLDRIPSETVVESKPVSVSDVKVEVAKKKVPATPMKDLMKKEAAKFATKPVVKPVVKVEVAKKEVSTAPKKTTITMSELNSMMQKSISAVAAK